MQRNFERSLERVLEHEGGYVDHPKDPGGATNKGITIATYRRYVNRNGTKADLKNLTVHEAGIVYKKQYWDKVRGDDLPDGLDYAVFDFAVNSGPGRAAKYLQAIVGAKQDGAIGPKTLIAVAESPQSTVQIIDRLCADRLAFLKRLKHWPTFGGGWTARVSAVNTYAVKWANEAGIEAPEPLPRPEPVKREPVVPDGLDKPMAKSKTLWSMIVANGAGIITAFASLDWKVALPIVLVIGVAGVIIYRERHKYAKEARKIMAEIG